MSRRRHPGDVVVWREWLYLPERISLPPRIEMVIPRAEFHTPRHQGGELDRLIHRLHENYCNPIYCDTRSYPFASGMLYLALRAMTE